MLYIGPLACFSISLVCHIAFQKLLPYVYFSQAFAFFLALQLFVFFFPCYFLQSFNCTFLTHVAKHIVNTKHECSTKKHSML
jgi:hypothetical protein